MLARWGHLLWDEAGVPRENPPLKAGDHHTLSYTATVDHGDRTWVAAMTSESYSHYATWTPTWIFLRYIFCLF